MGRQGKRFYDQPCGAGLMDADARPPRVDLPRSCAGIRQSPVDPALLIDYTPYEQKQRSKNRLPRCKTAWSNTLEHQYDALAYLLKASQFSTKCEPDQIIMEKTSLVIAEAGVNHNGSLDLALQLVERAHQAGADIVKFQTFKSSSVISEGAPKAEYQKTTTGTSESQLDMVRKLELDRQAHLTIRDRCDKLGIEFLSTPFDIESAELLVKDLGVSRIKIPSGEVTNAPFILALARYRLPIILSTGMSTLGEVEAALAVIAFGLIAGADAAPGPEELMAAYVSREGQGAIRDHVTLLHCTTEYPAAFADTNLRAMDTLAQAFGVPVGLSDHTPGIVASIAAVARGAIVIEKHFTMDRNMPGPDHAASLEPDELTAMIAGIRNVDLALGDGRKIFGAAEAANRKIARRSLVALHQVKKGETWNADNLGCKRPGTGLSPFDYWRVLGTHAERDYARDEQVEICGNTHA